MKTSLKLSPEQTVLKNAGLEIYNELFHVAKRGLEVFKGTQLDADDLVEVGLAVARELIPADVIAQHVENFRQAVSQMPIDPAMRKRVSDVLSRLSERHLKVVK